MHHLSGQVSAVACEIADEVELPSEHAVRDAATSVHRAIVFKVCCVKNVINGWKLVLSDRP